jgi:hypothetical protein
MWNAAVIMNIANLISNNVAKLNILLLFRPASF